MNDLPLLPSERKDLENKVKEANQRAETIYAATLRKVTAIINNHESLTAEQRDSILYRVWNE